MSYETVVDEDGRSEVVYVQEEPDPEYCPGREDQQHCNHWYDGSPCCGCGDNTPQPGDDLSTYADGEPF